MSGQREEKRLFTRRAFIFAGIKLAVVLIIVSRLSYLQVIKSNHYKLLSDRNRLVVKQTLPARGKVLDRDGKVLASNKSSYTAILDIFEIPKEERNKTINIIKNSMSLDEKVVENLNNLPETINRKNRFIVLQEDLSWNDLASYYILSSDVSGIIIDKFQTRLYLYPQAFSHIIGYISSPTKEDIENSDNVALMIPMAKIGKIGIEKEYNDLLFGKAGIDEIEVNSRRQFVRSIENIESIPGEDIFLTINLELQLKVYEILSQYESASCVVMDVNTGAVLAFVSFPGFDPNIFTKHFDSKILKEYYQNPYKPMINKVISGLYSPGSAFKIITALAGLDSGVVNKHTQYLCSGVFELGRHKFHCWKHKYGGHGYVDIRKALSQSCDVYFYNLAKLVSQEKIVKVANDFGLGLKTGIDLQNEKAGLIPTKNWKKERRKEKWTLGDTVNMSIGQGFVLSTPLQLAKMISILVNGLRPITPYLKKSKSFLQDKQLDYKSEHIEIIMEGLYDVVNSPYGTARKSAINDEDFEMAGKTGSSQVYRITEAQRKLGKTVSDDYWKKEHAVFVGYAPADDPKLAISVLVEHGGGGAHAAAPIAKEVLLATRNIMGDF